MTTRYDRDYRGDMIPREFGDWVRYVDHIEEANNLRRRIVELLHCVHGEFCATGLDLCRCGKEIEEIKGEM